MKQRLFSTALMLSTLLGAAAAQSSASDSSVTSAQQSAASSASTAAPMSATSAASASASLPESALAVRRILESRGLLNTPAPARLPAPRGLTIPDSLRALLPNAVWDQATTGATSAPVADSVTVDSSDLSAAQAEMVKSGAGSAAPESTAPLTDAAASGTAGSTTDASLSEGSTPDPAGPSVDMVGTTGTASDMTATPAVPDYGDSAAAAGVTGTASTGSAGTGTATTGAGTAVDSAAARQTTGNQGAGAPATAGQNSTQAQGETILSALQADGRFGTFLSLVKFAGLEEAILDDQYTLLVPTDEAFAALDPALVQAVKADPEVAGYVLGYHVVPGTQTPGQGTLTNVYGEALPADLKVTGKALTAGGTQAYALSSVIVPAELTGDGSQGQSPQGGQTVPGSTK